MKTVLRLSIVVVLAGLFLGGCGCFQQAMKGETPPPAPPGSPSRLLLLMPDMSACGSLSSCACMSACGSLSSCESLPDLPGTGSQKGP